MATVAFVIWAFVFGLGAAVNVGAVSERAQSQQVESAAVQK